MNPSDSEEEKKGFDNQVLTRFGNMTTSVWSLA